MERKKWAMFGAIAGLAMFLGVALLPALLYGGYAGVLLAGGLFGTPLVPTLAVRALIVFGMVMGTTAVASLFTVAGAACGALVSTVLSVVPAAKEVASKS